MSDSIMTENDLNRLDDDLNEFHRSPLPNKYGNRILDGLHKNFAGSPPTGDWTMYGGDFLGNINDTGCFLNDGLFVSTCYNSYGKRDDDEEEGCLHEAVGSPDYKKLSYSLNISFPVTGIPSSNTRTRTIIYLWADSLLIEKDGEMIPNPVDVKNITNRFAAMLRMAFGNDGFHYLCSLSHNPELRKFSTSANDEIVDAAAYSILIQETKETRGSRCSCEGGADGMIYIYENKHCRTAMMNSICSQKWHDLLDM